MPVGRVTKYNQLESVIFGTAGRQWDDSATGSCMFVLAKSTYTPSTAHTTLANVGSAGVDYITTGDGSPIALATPTIDKTTTLGTTYFRSADADFGSAVTIAAKYLLCVQPVDANIIATTAKLIFYVDLNTIDTGSSASSSADVFKVNTPSLGWFRTGPGA
jgi:hypothetical protein